MVTETDYLQTRRRLNKKCIGALYFVSDSKLV